MPIGSLFKVDMSLSVGFFIEWIDLSSFSVTYSSSAISMALRARPVFDVGASEMHFLSTEAEPSYVKVSIAVFVKLFSGPRPVSCSLLLLNSFNVLVSIW